MATNTKVCGSCREEKELSLFYKKTKKTKVSVTSDCISCIKNKQAAYRSNPLVQEKARERSKLWREENPDKVIANNKIYSKKHYENNKHLYQFKAALREDKLKVATPAWANLEDIRRVYELCRKISERTGVKHEVDHAVPLKGKNVCGLHVFNNLQIVPMTLNRAKSNKFEPERTRDWE
jgi:hypothetical protein